jgi:hypothetical protein
MNDDNEEKSFYLCPVSAPSASLRDSFLSSAEKQGSSAEFGFCKRLRHRN